MKRVEVISEAQIQTEVGPRNVKLGEVFELEDGHAAVAESLGIVKVLGDVSKAPAPVAEPVEEIHEEESNDDEAETTSDEEEQADLEDESKG